MTEKKKPGRRPRYAITFELSPELAGRFEALRFRLLQTGIPKATLATEAILLLLKKYEAEWGPLAPNRDAGAEPREGSPPPEPGKRKRGAQSR